MGIEHGPPSSGMNRSRSTSPMRAYRAKKDAQRKSVQANYSIQGFLASGTYGRVYKARVRLSDKAEGQIVAIKKFKPDKEGETQSRCSPLPGWPLLEKTQAYTGISQSACREIMLNRELHHVNLTALREVLLEDKAIYMIFEYAEHDFLVGCARFPDLARLTEFPKQIIHHHATNRTTIPHPTLKTLMWQLLNGVTYLHDNWVIHRDLKPANILVTNKGEVKIGDLGLARIYAGPLQSLYNSDKVVVTIWYRPPELLMGSRHYTTSVDVWSVGCIYGELIALRPMFKGEEAKMETATASGTGNQKKSSVPFQRDQLTKIFEVLGTPTRSRWPTLPQMPEYNRFSEMPQCVPSQTGAASLSDLFGRYSNELQKWYHARMGRSFSSSGLDLMSSLLMFEPAQRMSARDALTHKYWEEEPKAAKSNFPENVYPLRKISRAFGSSMARVFDGWPDDESDPKMSTAPTSYKTGSAVPPAPRPNKRSRLE